MLPKSKTLSPLCQRTLSGIALVVLVLSAIFFGFPFFVVGLGLGLSLEFAWALDLLPTFGFLHRSKASRGAVSKPWLWWLGSLPYFCFSLYSLFKIHKDYGELFTLWIFILLWLTDTGAFFVGRSLGKRKLAPRLSPGKTWAGFWGGIVVATLVDSGLALVAVPRGLSLPRLAFFLAGLSSCAHLGDLLESAIKRRLGVKDMSQLIPGHGGLADRFDSLLLVGFVLGMLRSLKLGG